MADKIYLGISKDYEEEIYITKHTWDCGWYWAFGYLGNHTTYFHIKKWLDNSDITDNLKSSPIITQEVWWKLGDLFKQAYALQKVADVYHRGGANWSETGEMGISKDLDKCKEINKDLLKVLEDIWKYLEDLLKETR